MDARTKIKNDLWRVNYIVPFVKKYRVNEKGRADLARRVLSVYRSLRPVKGRGRERTVGGDVKALLEKVRIEIPDAGFVYFLDTGKTIAVPGNIVSNFTIDYARLLNEPLLAVAANVEGNDLFSTEIRAVVEGIEDLRRRICEAIPSSGLPDAEKEKRLREFERMLSQPAASFEEGLQRVLFFNQIMWQTRHRLNGLGRMDLYLGDLYDHDVQNGILTREQAKALIDDFLEKLSRHASYKSDALEGDIGQIILLGGLQEDGSYFHNALTELFLVAQADSKKPDPKTFLRVSAGMPTELMALAVDCLQAQTGSPLFSNDDVVIPAMIAGGIDPEDAYRYCTSACWEPFVVGKSFDQNNMEVFDYEWAFDKLMEQADFSSREEMIDRYIEQNRQQFAAFLQRVDQLKWAKDPLVSLLTEGCCEKHTDIADGGAKYSNYGITTVGLANVIDSLCNLDRLVFEEKKYTMRQLADIRDRDFAEAEELNQWCGRHRYFGHDDPETIRLVNRITEPLAEMAEGYTNKYGGTVKFGFSSPGYNMLSKKSKADFSGRKAGMPYSTHISGDGMAYTEVVNFAGRLGYDRQRYNGNVVDYFLNLDFLRRNRDKFVAFMMGAIRAGFFQMQMNLMDSATLIDAKDHPEKYPGLIVRVWGFSAYFNDLPESYKDLMIERALAAEAAVG